MRKHRVVKLFGIVAGIIFLLINLLWGMNYIAYQKYILNSPEDPSLFQINTSYCSEKDGITYTVKKPNYLTRTGNLASVSADGNISILVWPSYLCLDIDSYGVMIYDPDIKHGYMFYVDEEMNFHSKNYGRLEPETAAAAGSALDHVRDQVLDQFQRMRLEFGF